MMRLSREILPLRIDNSVSSVLSESSEKRRIYVCECGNIRLETKHFRRTFAPEEFVSLLRQLFRNNRKIEL